MRRSGPGLVGAPECGDVMKLQVKVNPATGVIDDAKFKTFGCGSAIASSSLATEWLKGKTLDQALEIKNVDIVQELSLPPVKIHCSVLAEDAIKAAIADYKRKQGANGNGHGDERTVAIGERSRADADAGMTDRQSDQPDRRAARRSEVSRTHGDPNHGHRREADPDADGQAGAGRGRPARRREGRRLFGPQLHVRVGHPGRAPATRSSTAPRTRGCSSTRRA